MSDDDLTRIYSQHLRPPRAPRLGEWLVDRGLINRVQLFEALTVQARHRCRLGDALVWLGHVERGELELAAASRTPTLLPSGTRVRGMPLCGPAAPGPADFDATRPLRAADRNPND